MEGTQTDFYDQPLQVDCAVAEIAAFLDEPPRVGQNAGSSS
jgi:hypothetical protein